MSCVSKSYAKHWGVMMSNNRISVSIITASALFFSMLAVKEGVVLTPYRDSVGVPTIGIGSTTYEDGTPVKMSDKPITYDRAVQIAKAHASKTERLMKKPIANVALYQYEYDAYLDFVYQFGLGNWSTSSMVRYLNKGDYVSACRSMLQYYRAKKRNCKIRSNDCYGVWTRQVERVNKCLGG